MNLIQQSMFGSRRLLFIMMAVFLLLFMAYGVASAAFRAGGAGNCGNFSGAVTDAVDGDIVTQMTPARPSDGVVISESLRLSGGWFPNQNCDDNNQAFADATDFFDYGFLYTAPVTRSGLFHDGSVLSIELSAEKTIIEHFELDGLAPIAPNIDQGGGLSGTLTAGAELVLDNVMITGTNVSNFGGGIYLTVDNSQLIIEDSLFSANQSLGSGGGLYVTLLNNSEMVIDNTVFENNDAVAAGGAFVIHVDETSQLTIKNSRFISNQTTAASGDGGAGYLMIDGGRVQIMNSMFMSNQTDQLGGGLYADMSGGTLLIQNTVFDSNQVNGSTGTAGSGLYVVSSGSADAAVDLINVSFANNNGAMPFENAQTGIGSLTVMNYDRSIYLPLVMNDANPAVEMARILSIAVDSDYNYIVDFEANFAPNTASTHLHFFFDTVAPDQAGLPAPPSNWKIYGASSPFTGYSFRDRPFEADGAEQLCVLVANADHTVRLGTGNCVKLP